jgi:hypothetical protein
LFLTVIGSTIKFIAEKSILEWRKCFGDIRVVVKHGFRFVGAWWLAEEVENNDDGVGRILAARRKCVIINFLAYIANVGVLRRIADGAIGVIFDTHFALGVADDNAREIFNGITTAFVEIINFENKCAASSINGKLNSQVRVPVSFIHGADIARIAAAERIEVNQALLSLGYICAGQKV